MIDVLVAIVILGIASATIYMSLATGYAALVRSSHRTWATIIAGRILVEQELGLEQRRRGEAYLPWTGTSYQWDLVEESAAEADGVEGKPVTGPAVGVSWDGQGVSGRIVVGGFLDPVRAR